MNEFWIGSTPNGNIYTPGGVSSPVLPFDGSTQALFDETMFSLPSVPTLIHLGVGTFVTNGFYPDLAESASKLTWGLRDNWRLMGSGMNQTILKYPPGHIVGGSGAVMIGSVGLSTNASVEDLTCNCLCTQRDTYNGIILGGSSITVRNVRVTGCGKFGSNTEVFGLGVGGGTNNNILDCLVDGFAGGQGMTAISSSFSTNTLFRNNRVNYPAPAANQNLVGIGHSWSAIVTGNYVTGGTLGWYGDTGDSSGSIVTENQFLDVQSGCCLTNTNTYSNHLFANNFVRLTAGQFLARAFDFQAAGKFSHIITTNNIVVTSYGTFLV